MDYFHIALSKLKSFPEKCTLCTLIFEPNVRQRVFSRLQSVCTLYFHQGTPANRDTVQMYNIPNTNNRDSLYVFAIIGKQIYGFMPDVLL